MHKEMIIELLSKLSPEDLKDVYEYVRRIWMKG